MEHQFPEFFSFTCFRFWGPKRHDWQSKCTHNQTVCQFRVNQDHERDNVRDNVEFGPQSCPQTHVQFIRVFKYISTEHMELPAKLLDYFLRSNQSNIDQSLQRIATHCTTRTEPPHTATWVSSQRATGKGHAPTIEKRRRTSSPCSPSDNPVDLTHSRTPSTKQ